MKILKTVIVVVILVALAGGGWYWYSARSRAAAKPHFTTTPVVRSDLTKSISATGTVEPEELVNVGAQVSGKITAFEKDSNNDEVDYGSPVKAGMVLARIDDLVYEAEMREAEAQKLKAEAAILSSNANIAYSKAKLELAASNWERAQRLMPQNAMAKIDYDSYKAEYDAAKATVSINEATLAEAKASLASAVASYDKAKRNLEYCTITSPVDGVVIDRRVSIGQTVVSNMSASSMFLIAKDLKRMQVWASVNEADIGMLKPGMPVEFTVDAFPEDTFVGTLHKIRLNATMSQNVVTYVVEVATDNSSGKLLPYLTANVKFIQEARKGVLSVPNAALRFLPDAAAVPSEYHDDLAKAAAMRVGKERILWVMEGESIRPVQVKLGLNDGVMTEILSVHPDTSLIHIIETHEQIDQRRLSASGGSYDGDPPARLHGKVQILYQRFLFDIRKIHMLKLHLSGGAFQLFRVRRVRYLGRLFDQFEDPRRACQRILQLCDDAGNVVKRLGVLVGVTQECRESAHGDHPSDGRQRSCQRHTGIHQIVYEPRPRVGQRRIKDRFQGAFFQSPVNLVKLLLDPLFHGECLHHLLAADHLVDQPGLLRSRLRLQTEHIVGVRGNEFRHK